MMLMFLRPKMRKVRNEFTLGDLKNCWVNGNWWDNLKVMEY